MGGLGVHIVFPRNFPAVLSDLMVIFPVITGYTTFHYIVDIDK